MAAVFVDSVPDGYSPRGLGGVLGGDLLIYECVVLSATPNSENQRDSRGAGPSCGSGRATQAG